MAMATKTRSWRDQALLLLLLLLLPLQLAPAVAGADAAGTHYRCPDLEATSFDRLFADAGGVIVRLNFSQLREALYRKNTSSEDGEAASSTATVSWLLLLYNPFGGNSIQYAAEFGKFARRIRKWNHTVRIAALDVGFPQENAEALAHFSIHALPALFFISKHARWGASQAAVQMPRDPMFLEDVLLSELEKFVPSLKPLQTVNRILRSSFTEAIILIEESPEGGGSLLARRALLDLLQAGPRIRVAWRLDAKLGGRCVRLSSYRKRRNRRIGAYVRQMHVEYEATSDSSLDTDGLLRLVGLHDQAATTVATPVLTPRAIENSTPPKDPATTAAAGCIADAALTPPKPADLLADATRLLRGDLADCVVANPAWPAVIGFIRLMAGALNTAAPVLTFASAALARLRQGSSSRSPDEELWRLTLDNWLDDNDIGGVEAVESSVWRLLHAMAAARVRYPQLQPVLQAFGRLRQACPRARLPRLAAATYTDSSVDSPVEEILTLWRWHNRARGRAFPPPSLCPSCLTDDSDGGVEGAMDALTFLVGWYGAVFETVPSHDPRQQPRQSRRSKQPRHWRLTASADDGSEDDGLPCILRLFVEGRKISSKRLAALLALTFVCGSSILLIMLLLLRRL